MSTLPQSFLALDFGLVRIGLAYGTRLLRVARPLKTLHAPTERERFAGIAAAIQDWGPEALVVGVPCHPDGQAHAMTQRCERLARQLQGRFNLPVFKVDERYSSVEAARERPDVPLDAAAAAVILQQFLDRLDR